MKILYIFSDRAMSGAAKSMLTLIQGVKNRGHEVYAVLPYGPEMDLADMLIDLHIEYMTVPIGFYAYPPKVNKIFLWWLWVKKFVLWQCNHHKGVRELIKIIKTYNIEIVHTSVGPVHCGYEASKCCNIPHVWHIREYGDLDFHLLPFPSKKTFRNKLRKSNVICITKALLSYNGLDNYKKATTIYNGVNSIEDTFLEFPKSRYFLSASRISPEKGITQMLNAFVKFHKLAPDFKLVILGDGPQEYIAELKKYCDQNEITENVIFLGYTKDVSLYMRKAHALLVCSPSEGFGRMTAEAAFAGCLVIGRNSAGTKEVLDIIGGFKFDSTEELIKLMLNSISLSTEEYKALVLNAQQKAKCYFSTEQYINKVMEVYGQCKI